MAFILHNDLLKVEIGRPGEWYRGARFDYTGNIRQVTLLNKHTFCTTEKPFFSNANGFGLMNEFDINGPAGYLPASVGEEFHKIGTGYLTKINIKPYDFFYPYPLRACKIFVENNSEKCIDFLIESEELRGIRYFYKKSISIENNNLKINYSLTNRGKEIFQVTEYCHNFLSLGKPVSGGNYSLEFNAPVVVDTFSENVNTGNIVIGGNKLFWNANPSGDFFIGNLFGKNSGVTTWKLMNPDSGLKIFEVVDFPVSTVNLWGSGHVICPELFFGLKIEVGETATWQREYFFSEG